MADMSVGSCILPMRYRGDKDAGVLVKRRNIASIVKGVPYEGPPDLIRIIGNVQQASPRELLRLPEGDRTKDSIVVHTEFALRTSDVRSGTLADYVFYIGFDWVVMQIEDRTPNDTFVRAVCVKVGQ